MQANQAKIQEQKQNDNVQREKVQQSGKYRQPNLKQIQNSNYSSVVHVHENSMGNVDYYGNIVQKNIANKSRFQNEHNQWKKERDRGQTNLSNGGNKGQTNYHSDFPKVSSNFDKQNPAHPPIKK